MTAMSKLRELINEEISELAIPRKGKDLYWGNKAKKKKERFARERDMNDETYNLRRNVMAYVYDAKNLLRSVGYDLPRQRVRIIDVDPGVFLKAERDFVSDILLGCASFGGNDIYIPVKTIEQNYDLRTVVFHEILHSAFCIDHDNESPLMGQSHKKMTPEDADKWFLKHVKDTGKIK